MTIETKFNIGDEVWFIYKDRCQHSKVESIRVYKHNSISKIEINYHLNGIDWLPEERLFSTKEELLKSL